MSHTDVGEAGRRSRLLLLAMAAWVLLAIALPLGALTLDAAVFAGYPLGFWIAAQGSLVALAGVALLFSLRDRGTRTRDGWGRPLALAGEAVAAAAVVGFAGAVAALGYDGLAFPLGLIAGLALMAIAVAPRLASHPVRSISGFFAARFGGVWPRRVALLIAATASILLLAADLRAGALAVQGLVNADYATGAAIISVAVALAWAAGLALGARLHPGVVYAVLLIALSAALSAFAARHGGSMLSYFAYADAMRDLAAMEQKLVAGKLSDAASLRPMSAPFLQASMQNFVGLVLAIALGVAALPHLLWRGVSYPAAPSNVAGRGAALATAWAALLLIGLVALAVYSRIGVAELVGRGLQTAAAPQQLLAAHGLNWVKICGTASGEDLAAACSTLSGHRGALRMQDLAFASDAFIIAAPWISELPGPVIASFWAAIAIAAISTGAAILRGYVDGAGEGRSSAGAPNALGAGTVVVVSALLICAAWLAIAGRIDAAHLLADGLALVAAGLFPAIVLGLYWRPFNGSGAVAAMLTGFALVLIYIVAVRAFPVPMFEWLGGLSNAAPGAIRNFETLRTAYDAAPPEQQRLLAAALQRHAATIANVGGLKPPAIVLFAAPLAVMAGVVATNLGRARADNSARPQS